MIIISYVIKGSTIICLSVSKGFLAEKIPPQLQLANLEYQSIARNILFMKLKNLLTTGIKGIADTTVYVPIEDNGIMNSDEKLPKILENSALFGLTAKE